MTTTADRYTSTPVAPEEAPPDRPRWVTPALLSLLVATAVLYLWGLGSSGWGNSYYAAAAQSGTQDLTAWLFGSLDPGNAITVDKPPAAMWVMALSGRLFGFSPFTMLLPQALMGVGAVALFYAAVRRCSGPAAGLIAGATPTPCWFSYWWRPRTALCGPPRRRARAGWRWRAVPLASRS